MKTNSIWVLMALICLMITSCQEEEIALPENELETAQSLISLPFSCDTDNVYDMVMLLNDTPPVVTDECSYKNTVEIYEIIYLGNEEGCFRVDNIQSLVQPYINANSPGGLPMHVRATNTSNNAPFIGYTYLHRQSSRTFAI